LVNIQKARAARRRVPLPWRSGIESRVIEQLVWQWWQSPAPRWPAYRVARLLGVSHTWVNKLAKRFKSDPARFRRRHAPFSPATLEKLQRAREETLWRRQHGWLRGPIRLRRVRYTLDDGKTRTAHLPTKSSLSAVAGLPAEGPERSRRAEGPESSRGAMPGLSAVADLRSASHASLPRRSPPQRTEAGLPAMPGFPPDLLRDLPPWARGLV
jgi:hypothetical protein